MLHFYWQIRYEHCDWTLKVATLNFTLYPNDFPEDLPIALKSEYNVTSDFICNKDQEVDVVNRNVSLSILLSDNVLETVPYIVCKMTRPNSNFRSREVYLQSCCDIPVTTTQETHTQITSTQAKDTTSITSTHFNTKSDDNNMCCTISSADQLYPYQVPHLHVRLALLYLITLLCCL